MSVVTDVSTKRARLLVGGEWIEGRSTFQVFDKYTGELIGDAEVASEDQVKSAVENARRSFETEKLDPYKRYEILMRAAQLIEQRRSDFVKLIVSEAGFPSSDANNEVTRAVQTFTTSAEEGKRLCGEIVPIEGSPSNAHRMAFTIRVPRGVVCGITSFNSPLNMVAHKVAPALAAGNTVVIKPPQPTPFSAALLFELLLAAGLPPSHANLLQGPGSEIGTWLVDNPKISFYSFTGSTAVGKRIRDGIGLRPIALELGSVSATIVCKDADLKRAIPRCLNSGFKRAGQACTSIQRLYVDETIADQFVELLIDGASKLVVGDPHDRRTEIGPMISEDEAKRAEAWVRDAVTGGAQIVYGGTRTGPLLQPTILTNVTLDMRIAREEVFAPVLSILPYRSLSDVIDQVNALPYGLAAGLFTQDINTAMQTARKLHVGIMHINESSSSRVDLMPFGGVKDSGLGREGPRYAMQEMTEERLITMSVG